MEQGQWRVVNWEPYEIIFRECTSIFWFLIILQDIATHFKTRYTYTINNALWAYNSKPMKYIVLIVKNNDHFSSQFCTWQNCDLTWSLRQKLETIRTKHFTRLHVLINHIKIGSRVSWWRHQMETFSALLATCVGNSPVPGEFLAQRPVTRSFDVFFDLRLNKRLSKQWRGWWFETPSPPLWRHRNVLSSTGSPS